MTTAASIVGVIPTILTLGIIDRTLRIAVPKPRKRKGKRVRIKVTRKGSLGGPGFFARSVKMRRRLLVKLAKKVGEKRVVGKLRAIQVFMKNKNPSLSEKARLDARFIASSFIGKKRVRTGTGLSRRKR